MPRSPLTTPLSRAGTFFILVAVLEGCSLHTVDASPRPPVTLPDLYAGRSDTAGEARQEGPTADRWWHELGDAGLDALMEQVLADNLDLRRAASRVEQAAAAARQAGAAWWPQVQASVGASRQQQNFFFNDQLGAIETITDSFPLSLGASYEIDVWGKVGHRTDAAALDVQAVGADLEAIAMTLAAQVTETWLGLVEARQQIGLIEEQVRTNETTLELLRSRFHHGMAQAVDLLQQEQQIVSAGAQLPLLRLRQELLAHQLAVLTGRVPGADIPEVSSALPSLPPPPAVGVPADLLQGRPDVRAARLRIVAADHRVGEAFMDQFPSLSISASTGFQGRDLTEIFSNWVWQIAAQLLAPLWDGGRRMAEVDRREAVVRDAIHAYGQTLLVAVREVEDALSQERRQREHIARLDAQIALARTTLEETRIRYLEGVTDYLPVQSALRALQGAELSRLSAHRQLLSYRIQLYRALGGTWTRDVAGQIAAAHREGDDKP